MSMSPQGRWSRLCVFLALWASIDCLHAQTATVSPDDEFRKAIKVSEDISPLGDNPFGEKISLYNGSLSFEQTDVSQAGTGPLLQLTRQFDLQGWDYFSATQGDHAFGDWEIDLPRIETMTSYSGSLMSWQTSGLAETNEVRNQRCSMFNAPPPVTFGGNQGQDDWTSYEWWSGYHLIVPGAGDQELLPRSTGNTLAPTMSGTSFPIVTKQNWEIGCLSQTTSGEPGEAFFAVAPDGTKYWFDYLVYRADTAMRKALHSGAGPAFAAASGGVHTNAANTDFLRRRKAWMLVSRIEDRFGNALTYTYDSGRLSEIDASDGRKLTVTYQPDSSRIGSVTLVPSSGPSRTWTYTYDTSAFSTPLKSVQLPDGSAWSFDLAGLVNARVDFVDAEGGSCYTPTEPANLSTSYSGSITHPSGLKGVFQVQPMAHGRSGVSRACWGVTSAPSLDGYAITPDLWYSLTLIGKQVSGAGLVSQSWNYGYSSPNASWLTDCPTAASCPSTVYTDVLDPGGRTTRYTFSNRYDYTESLLLQVDYYAKPAAGQSPTAAPLRRSETHHYADPGGTTPWPSSVGHNLQGSRVNESQTTQLFPEDLRQIVQDGDTYTWQAESFNAYTQVTKQKRSSSISGQPQLEETLDYLNDPNLWVLGLPTTVTNVATGEVESQNVYDSTKDTLSQRSRFGQPLMSYTFDSAGNLHTFTDGNGQTTTLGSYKRGIPQAISYPDGTGESLVVDDFGQITSLTDQAGKTTGYQYDAVGRLTQITYPTGDGVTWAPKVFTYAYVTGAERGLAANHWRRTVSHGDANAVTYFDAELRPVLSDSYLATDGNSHVSARTDYDWRGQKTFASYPKAGALNLGDLATGTSTQYDALGRATQTQQDSELGTLTSTTAYLSGARTQVTDPKGKVTTTTYQVFDQPAYDTAVLVQAPAGITQAIVRDVYGNPLSIRQYGSYDGLTADLTKYLYYDAYHRLCRTTEPESGSTVMHYDGANNVDWTADGLNIGGTGCGQDSVSTAAKTTRTYDAMNRVTTLAPPSGTQGTTYTYDARGNVATAVSGVSTWSSTRNGLGLLTGEALLVGTQNAWALGYGYDANGSLSTITYPDGTTVAYAPDALGRPTQAGSYANGVTYFPNGEVSAFTYGNGSLYAAQQNGRQLLSNFSYAQGTALKISEDYAYDQNANITAITDLVDGTRTKAFGYDALNRLTSATASNLWGSESYTYDPLNNIASRTGNSTTVTYNYNGLNQLTGLSDGTSFAYDPRGNVTSKNGVALTFDAKNQLQNVGGSVAYAYDASGRRVSKTPASGGATYYFYSQAGQLMYQWEPGSAKTTDYIYLGKRMIARDESYNTQVTGHVDGVNIDGSGNATVVGWACSTHLDTSITVHFYAGGPSGTGTSIGAYAADQSSEPSVATACQANGSHYRFSIPISTAVRTQYAGQGVYIHGISPVGQANPLLADSGTYLIPVPAVAGAPTVTSPTSGSSNATGSYAVTWSAVTDATSYTLQEQVNAGSWSTIQTSSATSKAISGKGNGSYGYRVQACNSSGCGAWSTVVTTTVLLPPAVPASITVPATSSGSVPVSWSASSTATSYTLQQSFNGESWSTIYTGAATSYTRTVTATGSHTYQVQACNSGGCSGWKVSSAVAVTIPPGSAPTLTVPSSSNTGAYTVSWTGVSGATSYTLVERTNGGAWSTIQTSSATSKAISGKGNGTYGYQVQACNAGGCGGWSSVGNTTVLLPPATPASISVPATSTGSVAVSWSGSSTATSYTLQQSLNGGSWSTVYTGASTSSTRTLTTTGSYTYQVQACNGGGCSGWQASSAVAVTIPPGSAPSLTAPSPSTTGSYTVSWTGVSGATSYTLQEQTNGGGWSTIQTGSATSKAISGKSNGTYGYQVQACNAGGCSGWSAVANVAVTLIPETPAAPHASYTGTSFKPNVTVTWSAVANATSYQLEQTDPQYGTQVVYTGSDTSWHRFVIATGTVTYKLSACSAAGCSAYSANSNNLYLNSGSGGL